MTCIVGVVEGNKVVMGADSCFSSGDFTSIRNDRKLFRKGKFILGCAGSPRVSQLLHYKLRVPTSDVKDPHEFLATVFADAVRKCLKENGAATVVSNEEASALKSRFLVGYGGKLYHVEGDFQVGEYASPYGAIGSGASYALGALHALPSRRPAVERVAAALEAAAHFSGSVAPPFYYEAAR